MLVRRNLASSFLPMTSLQVQLFHSITHSFAQRRHAIPPILNSFHTLLPLTAISFFASHFPAFVRFRSSVQLKSRISSHLQPLVHLQKSQLLWNQTNPASFCKTPGVGVGVP